MKKYSRIFITVLTLVVFFTVNTIGVLAVQRFTDVGSNHWAKEYIERMAEKGIVTGYDDATFRPSKNVSKLATIIMIYRTLKAADKLENVDIDSLVEKYDTQLKENNIPSWPDAHESVAFALEQGIIHEDELEVFIVNGAQQNAKRSDVAVFLGKALNLYLKEDLANKIITFDFNDAEFITTAAAPYVDLLVRNNIVQGDAEGNFNPNNPIMRAAVAKMLSVAYDILVDLEVEEEEVQLTTEEAKISLIVEENNSIVVQDDEGNRSLYRLTEDVEIVENGREADIDDLQEDMEVKLYFDEDDNLVKVEIDYDATSFEGTVYSTIDMNGYYLITVRDKDNSKIKKTFKTDDDTVLILNEKEADFSELQKGDTISLEVEGDVAKEITAQSKTRIYEGILESGVVFDGTPKILVKSGSQKVYELELDDDVEIEKNNKEEDLMDLVKGDLVTVTVEYEKVVKIVATSVKNEDEGVITEIIIAKEPKITILNDDNDEVTYTLASNADIEVDNRDASIYDLRLNYRVEVNIESDTITKLEAEMVEVKDQITGYITEIYEDLNIISVRSESDPQNHISVLINDDTTIISETGKGISLRYLDEDDKVFIYGSQTNSFFVAERIMVLE